MVFKRRKPRSYAQAFRESLYPRGGWRRAALYVGYRLRRLPDPAHKISRGIAAGVFTSFTPFFGLHFVISALLALAMRGNILAALLATFIGNPVTFPFIGAAAMEFAQHVLGFPPYPLNRVFIEFGHAAAELWRNAGALFSPADVHWVRLPYFLERVFVPYLLGGIIPGIIAALVAYYLSNPLIAAYQKARAARIEKKMAQKRSAKALKQVAPKKAKPAH